MLTSRITASSLRAFLLDRLSSRLRPCAALIHDLSGVAMLEFALLLPLLITIGFYGTEIAYMASVNMQVSQIAASVADNASRLGQTDNTAVAPTVSESDVNTIMNGALEQGKTIGLRLKGRVILSSLEVHPGDNKQWIHWQRCTGTLNETSAYGNDSNRNGVNGPAIAGLGRYSTITAQPGTAVMFVEVYYKYQGLFGTMFVGTPVFRQEAAFLVRDGRDLLQSSAKGLAGTTIGSPCT